MHERGKAVEGGLIECQTCEKKIYRISSYSFRGNYSFLNLEIRRSKVTVHKGVETIQGRKLFKGGNYMRKYSTHLGAIQEFWSLEATYI